MRHNNLSRDQIQQRISRSLYHKMFSPEVLSINNDTAELVLKVSMRPEFERQPDTNQWHGGVLASLVDIAGCYALMLVAQGPMLTLNFSTDFLRLAVSESLTASAKVTRVGRTVGFVDVSISDEKGDQVVTGRACYAIRPASTQPQ